MRTKFFRQVGVELNELQLDLAVLRRIGGRPLRDLAEFLGQGRRLILKDEALGETLTEFLKGSDISAEAYARGRRLSLFLVDASLQFEDTPADLAEDLNELIPLGNDVHDFLRTLCPAIERASFHRRIGKLARRGLPTLTEVTYVCDVRADFPDFDPHHGDAAQRRAEPRLWVPVALLHFGTDEDAELSCQVEAGLLDRVIKGLLAAQADLRAAKASLDAAGLQTFDPTSDDGVGRQSSNA